MALLNVTDLPRPSDENICGLLALVKGIAANYPDLPQPTLQELRDEMQEADLSDISPPEALLSYGPPNTDNISAHKLGAILSFWGKRHGLNLQVAYIVPGPDTFPKIVGNNYNPHADTKLVWIQNNHDCRAPDGRLFDVQRPMNHWSALAQPSDSKTLTVLPRRFLTGSDFDRLGGYHPNGARHALNQPYTSEGWYLAPPEAQRELGGSSLEIRQPPCECIECSQQFRTTADQHYYKNVYTRAVSRQAAQKKCDGWVHEIFSSQTYLRDVLSKHGNTIVSRWKKRSVAKRTLLLQNVFPGIVQKKHDYLETRYTENWVHAREKHHNFHVAIYLTSDQLSSDWTKLLSLLAARTQYDAGDWVAYNVAQTKAGWSRGSFDVEFCEASVVMHGSEYGQVREWEESSVHRWTAVGYPRAQLVLESQAFVLKLLRKVVEQILIGVEVQSLCSRWNELVQTGFRRSKDQEAWSVLSNQAFLWPPSFDANLVLELCESRLALAQDELWLLQTDPSYMQHALSRARKMKLNLLAKSQGDSEEAFVYKIATREPVQRVQEWYDVVAECRNVMALREKYAGELHHRSFLPPEYENAVACCELMATRVLQLRIQNVLDAATESPSFRDKYIHVPDPASNSIISKLRSPIDSMESFKADRLFWCLIILTANHDGVGQMDPALLFSLFDDILATDPSSAARIDERLMDMVSDLAALWELRRAIRMQRPLLRSINMKEALMSRSDGGWEECREVENCRASGSNIRQETVPNRVNSLVTRMMTSKVPTGRRDLAWLQSAQESHTSLRELWVAYRETRRKYLQSLGLSAELIDTDLAKIAFDEASEHQTALQKEREKVMARLRKQESSLSSLSTAMPQWPTSEPETPGNREVLLQVRTKVKTRVPSSTGTASEEHSIPRTTATEEPPIQEKITLKPDSLQVFHRMFPADDENATEPSGLVDWRRFVGAMTDAGFSSRQNTGSAVTFTNEHGKIVFHKPHPLAKIDHRMLLRFGKRINKWFGFARESFQAA